MPKPRIGSLLLSVGLWTGGAAIAAQICITVALLAGIAAMIGKVVFAILFLAVGVVTGCSAIFTTVLIPLCGLVVLATGLTLNLGNAIGQAIGAAVEQVGIQLGPESDQWPIVPTDARTAALLELGRQTAARRTSLDLELTGDYIDSFVHREKVRVRLRWRKPNLYRIDVAGEWTDDAGKKSPFQRTYLRAAADQLACFDHDARILDLFQHKNGKEVLDAFSMLRWEPLPWFFPNVHDVIQKRWKFEHAGVDAQGARLKLTPAHERWKLQGEIRLDPHSGMPRNAAFANGLLGASGDVKVERLIENAPLADDLFLPTPPEGWEVKRHGLGNEADANDAARILLRPDRQIAATPG